MYGLSITGEPIDEPLTASEVKIHLGIAASIVYHDAYLENLITAARKYVEDQTGRSLLTTQWRFTSDRVPVGRDMLLPRAPLQSVDEITYLDNDGVEQTWDSDNYRVSTNREPGTISLAYGAVWPTVRFVSDSFQVLYTAGYGDSAAFVPSPIRQAMLLMVGHWFAHREEATPTTLSPAPFAAQHLIAAYRVGEEFACYEL